MTFHLLTAAHGLDTDYTPTKFQFNAAIAEFSDNHKDIRQACIENIQSWVTDNPKPTGWPREDVWKLRAENYIKGYKRTIDAIDRYARHAGKPLPGGVTDLMIERAKEHPIEEVYESHTGNQTRHGMVLCPFHDDTKPSMSLRRYNRYRCFTCDEKGSVIDLYMKFNNCSFIQAVKALC